MIVLVVDDEPLVRLGISAVLEEMGHQSMTAATGRQAMQLLAERPEIELLLTDIRMPGLSGQDLVLRCREQRPEMKIIFMTGYSASAPIFPDDGTVRLEKPFSVQNLIEAISSAR